MRKHLNADTFIARIRRDFPKIQDLRGANSQISLADALMSVLAMFQLGYRYIGVTDDNVYQLMRAGRVRWKTVNETCNTLKNQGYNLGHNYGLGTENLSGVFTTLMMLTFLVDQAHQLGCWLFQAALSKLGTKRGLWETVRTAFTFFEIDSMERL